MPKVSVLIPIYNVEKYLRQCLDSVVNQTLKDIEIICINDGSTDNSLSIIKEFADRDKRIKIIDKKNTGYGHSMNCGLEIAQGEYIGIIESDDFADLNMFETLYNQTDDTKIDIVKSNYWDQVGDYAKFMEVLNPLPYDQIFSPKNYANVIFQRPIAVWSAIYRREFLVENNIFFQETPGASYQDVSFVFKSMCCAEKAIFIKNAFLHYRVDNPNASMKSKQKIYCIFDEFDEMERFLSQSKGISDLFKYALSPLKFRQCERHYPHIDDDFKFDFFQRMIKEFEKDNLADHLNKDYWSERKWQQLQEILNNPKKSFHRQCELVQAHRAYQQALFSKIESCCNTYLYGAGKIASSILFHLLRSQVNVKGIIVSNLENNPHHLMGVPVNIIEKFDFDREKDLILISIKAEDQDEILYKLKLSDCKNILLMTKEIRAALGYMS